MPTRLDHPPLGLVPGAIEPLLQLQDPAAPRTLRLARALVKRLHRDAHDGFNQTLTTVNDAVVRLGILEGDFHWHKHDQDEFFLVLDGKLLIDLEDRETVTLGHHQGYTVPRGVVHRTRARQRTAVLMVEAADRARPLLVVEAGL